MTVALGGELAATHRRPVAEPGGLAAKIDHLRVARQRAVSIQPARIVADPAVADGQPPVAAVEVVAHAELGLLAAGHAVPPDGRPDVHATVRLDEGAAVEVVAAGAVVVGGPEDEQHRALGAVLARVDLPADLGRLQSRAAPGRAPLLREGEDLVAAGVDGRTPDVKERVAAVVPHELEGGAV